MKHGWAFLMRATKIIKLI